MSVRVKIPTQLRKLAGDNKEIQIDESGTIGEVFDAIKARHPELMERVLDEQGEIRRFINVYLGEDDIRFLQGLETPLGDEKLISILPAVAGGASSLS